MISDEQLNSLAITFGIVMMTLIVIYHAVDSTMSPKNRTLQVDGGSGGSLEVLFQGPTETSQVAPA
nr:Chain B, Dolichyl-diphosphooligosaccharide--protein glycosyltransferase subunit OST4 [Saccharomyces cerevisiae]8AGC_B Chain B, OST4 isoform 1 [Saccharomyces cerevisiae]8AGE_B Chain B, OST4 isoform 1 [Saccharomyces cerevisiae]